MRHPFRLVEIAGKALYGHSWQSRLARDLDLTRQEVSRWKRRGWVTQTTLGLVKRLLHYNGLLHHDRSRTLIRLSMDLENEKENA